MAPTRRDRARRGVHNNRAVFQGGTSGPVMFTRPFSRVHKATRQRPRPRGSGLFISRGQISSKEALARARRCCFFGPEQPRPPRFLVRLRGFRFPRTSPRGSELVTIGSIPDRRRRRPGHGREPCAILLEDRGYNVRDSRGDGTREGLAVASRRMPEPPEVVISICDGRFLRTAHRDVQRR